MTPTNNLGWLGAAPQQAATPTLPPPPNMLPAQPMPQYGNGWLGGTQPLARPAIPPQQMPVAGGPQWQQNTQHPALGLQPQNMGAGGGAFGNLIGQMRRGQQPAPQRPTAPQFNADALRQMATKAKSTTQPVKPPSVGYIGGR